MPSCSTGLAPPAFTAPCRNQTSDVPVVIASDVPASRISVCREFPRLRARWFLWETTALSTRLQFRDWIGRHQVRNLCERQVFAVSLREGRRGDSPRNPQRGVVPGDADFCSGIVHGGALVLDLRERTEDAEPVRKPRRDVA